MSEQPIPLADIPAKTLRALMGAHVSNTFVPWPGLGIWLEYWPREIGLGFTWKIDGRYICFEFGPFLLMFDWN